MKNYKAYIFDIDGTLLDTMKMNILPLIQVMKKEKNITYTYEELTHLMGFSGTIILDKLEIAKKDNERVLHEWIDEIQKSGIVSTPYNNIYTVLDTLKQQGMLLGIVSSKEKRQYEFDIVGHQMDEYFQAVVLADDTKLHKPHPDPLQLCLKKLQLRADEVLYIGDSNSDGLCAQACGCDFAYASWGNLKIEVACQYYLKEPMDVLKIKAGGVL